MVVIINKTELMTNLSKCRTGAAPTCQADMINDSYIAQEEGYGFHQQKTSCLTRNHRYPDARLSTLRMTMLLDAG